MLDRKQKAFSDDDTKALADMFHKFKSNDGYEDVAGEFYAATTQEIVKQEYILTPGRYVGTAEEEDDGIPFAQKMEELTATLSEQFKESARLEEMIKKNLAGLGYEL